MEWYEALILTAAIIFFQHCWREDRKKEMKETISEVLDERSSR